VADLTHDLAERFLRDHPVRGLAVGLLTPDDRLVRGFGLADVEEGRSVLPDTAFGIGSITKLLVSIAVMQLVEQDRIRLDAPVNSHLRSFRVEARTGPPVSPRHLLTHTGGIGELHGFAALTKPWLGFGVRSGRTAPTLRELYGPVLRTEVAADSKWAYANHGFAVLGQLVADVSGQPLRDYLVEHVLDPLTMRQSDLGRTARLGPQAARGYKPQRRLRRSLDLEPTIPAAGAGWSTAPDLLRLAASVIGGGGGVVRRQTIDEMLEPQFRIDPRLPGRGLGFHLGSMGEHRVVGHDGAVPGFSATLLIAPEAGAAAVALANANNLTVGAATHKLAADLLRNHLGVPDPALLLPRNDIEEQPDVWPQLTGTYLPERGVLTSVRSWWLGAVYDVRPSNGHLVLRTATPRPAAVRLCPVDPTDPLRFQYVGRGGLVTDLVFVRDPAGEVSSFCTATSTGAFTRLRRVRRRRPVR
jgi:CubicO group peptidase (beta-lactamase class C family)